MMAEIPNGVIVDPTGRGAEAGLPDDVRGTGFVRHHVDPSGGEPSNPGQHARRSGPSEAANSDLYVRAHTHRMSRSENFTVRMDEELKRRMKDHPEINWSHVIREHVRSVLDDIERMDRLASGSGLTEDDVEALASVIDAAAADSLRADLASRDRSGGDQDGRTEDEESRRTHDVTDADAT